MKTGRRDPALTLAILAVFAYLARTLFFGGSSADLVAVWLSGLEFGQGHFDRIYPRSGGLFTMQPPDGWLELARAVGHDGPVYPYIYPPLWAALLSPRLCHINPGKPDKSTQSAITPPQSHTIRRMLRCVFDGVSGERSDGVAN